MYSFNIILTENCNAFCTHCYMNESNKSKRKTLTTDIIDLYIEKIPKNTRNIVLTGGEVFLIKDLLYYTITKINKAFPNVNLGLESNGIHFYKNINRAGEELKELKRLGVSFIRFSDDPFHAAGGVDLEKVRRLKKLESNNTPIIKYLVQDKAVPLGKAKNIDKNYMSKANCMNSPSSLDNPYLFIDIDGEVYTCAWKCVPSVGNLVNDSFDTIENRLLFPINKLILSGNIEQAIAYKTNEDIKKLKIKSKNCGQCRLCIDTFSRGNINGK